MPKAAIIGACRTPIGRYGGALAKVRPDDLAALVIETVVQRSGIDANGSVRIVQVHPGLDRLCRTESAYRPT